MILCILKGILPLKMHKIIFFPENLKKKIIGFMLNAGIFGLKATPKSHTYCRQISISDSSGCFLV